eukprot:5254770-Pleurochrysis_carterae.AAC.2
MVLWWRSRGELHTATQRVGAVAAAARRRHYGGCARWHRQAACGANTYLITDIVPDTCRYLMR